VGRFQIDTDQAVWNGRGFSGFIQVMSRRGTRRKNWATLLVLLVVLVVALAVVVIEFADPATKGRLYGWLPAKPPATAPAAPSHP
jgi:hypothetical protein